MDFSRGEEYIIAMRETVLQSVFLDLIKSFDALYRDQCLDILAWYGVGPRTLRILRTYWVWLHMAEKAGGGITVLSSRTTMG